MRKQLAVLAATAVLGVTSVLAAHPFSDVTAQDWAYQAVERLAAEGVIQGYPDGTFKGQRNITRYEMAQMIARADAHQDEVTAEQRATIQRLANEFANELQAFGVRVNRLEDKVGNFKFSGDARLRYDNVYPGEHGIETLNGKSSFYYRARLKFEATIDEKTKATVRLSTGDTRFDEEGHSGTSIDEAYVQHQIGKHVLATVGRKDYIVGNGLTYDDSFSGVKLRIGDEKLNTNLSFGYINSNGKKAVSIYEVGYRPNQSVNLKGFYIDRHSSKSNNDKTKKLTDIFGGSLDVYLGSDNKIWLGGEYARKERQGADGESWIVGGGYGKADILQPRTWDVKVQYFNFKKETFVKYTTYDVPTYYYNFVPAHANAKGWLATVDYTLTKNLGLSAYASFKSKTQDNVNKPELYRLDLNYQF